MLYYGVVIYRKLHKTDLIATRKQKRFINKLKAFPSRFGLSRTGGVGLAINKKIKFH